MRIRAIIFTIFTAMALAFYLGASQLSFAVGESLPGYVTYLVEDTIYIEIVGEHHVKVGDTGVLKIKGRDYAYVRVTETGTKYLYLLVITQYSGVQLNAGDSIVFETRTKAEENKPSAQTSRWHELDKLILGGELDMTTTGQVAAPLKRIPMENVAQLSMPSAPALVPSSPNSASLLAPKGPSVPSSESAPPVVQAPATASNQAPAVAASTVTGTAPMVNAGPAEPVALVLKPLAISAASKAGNSQDANIYHGRLRNREILQTTPSPGATHTVETRLDFDGSVERLRASPWSVVWSGNESYRNGNTGQGSPDYKHPQLNIYTAMMARRTDDGGGIKLGRFLPSELPGIGFLDGGQLEHVFSPQWRMGGVLAMRPDRINLDPTTKEPIQSAYASTEQGTHGQLYYSGTYGLYHTFYRGTSDELALLTDQRADFGPKLNLFSSSQIDFNGGAAEVHKGPQLVRLDLFGNSPITQTVSVRAGLSHFQRPDDAVERDLSAGTTQGFDLGYWRYSIGANERLPYNFSLDEDLSTINSATSPTDQLWRVTMSRFGLPFLPRGQISMSAYNVTSSQGRGFGFQSSLSTPVWRDKLNLNLSSSSQYSTVSNTPKTYDVNDASARLNWTINKVWNADLGVTQSYQSGRATSTVGDTSIGYRW